MRPASTDPRPLRIVVMDDWDGVAARSPAVTRLRQYADVTVLGRSTDSAFLAAAGDADVVIPIRERRPITEDLLEQLPRLKHIAQTGGGIAHIDMQAVEAAGVVVTRTGGASAHSVAELVVALMVASCRGLVYAANSVREGRWERPLGRQLAGSVLGVVGFGATGQRVASVAQAMGMQVIVCSRRAGTGSIGGFEAAPLLELCERSDVVSLHVELGPQTEGMLSMSELQAVGPEGLLVNTARAGLVVRDDLLAALNAGALGGAALDVFHAEPVEHADPIASHPNVLATPHLGWRTRETLDAYLTGAVENILSWIQQLDHRKDASNP